MICARQFYPVCLAFTLATGSAAAKDLSNLKLLYLGTPGSPRAEQYAEFLRPNVAQVKVMARVGFDPAVARRFDVVLLDWLQGQGPFPPKQSPLGPRDAWSTPTVLLGSAGLQVAVLWKGKGGAG